MPLHIDIRADLRPLQRELSNFASSQVPFATAKALTIVAKEVKTQATSLFDSVFDRPTAFTKKSVGVKGATKKDLRAIVYVKDIAAKYLEPYEFGGTHAMPGNGRTWLNPKDSSLLNQYGNLPRNKLAQLRGRADIFIGKIKTRNGEEIDGVWQRPTKGRGKRGSNTTGHLKLLIRFGDALPVTEQLGYMASAKRIVKARIAQEFETQIALAIASARR